MNEDIGDEVSYAEEHTILGKSIYWTVWRPGWILKIAKTGNFYIQYETERPYRGGWGSTEYCYRKRWVRPMGADHHVFPAVESLPDKPFKAKKIVKSCKNCDNRSNISNCGVPIGEVGSVFEGYSNRCNWTEYIGYDDGSTINISDKAWEAFIHQ